MSEKIRHWRCPHCEAVQELDRQMERLSTIFATTGRWPFLRCEACGQRVFVALPASSGSPDPQVEDTPAKGEDEDDFDIPYPFDLDEILLDKSDSEDPV